MKPAIVSTHHLILEAYLGFFYSMFFENCVDVVNGHLGFMALIIRL